jgi:uncharacterized protein
MPRVKRRQRDASINSLMVVRLAAKGRGVVASVPIREGATIMLLQGRVGSDAETNDASLQIGPDLFLESDGGLDDFVNHSCDPSCLIDWHRLAVVARRAIPAEEEITIDYNTAELDLTALLRDHAFACRCDSPRCVGHVRGFCHLSPTERFARREFLSPYLAQWLRNEIAGQRPCLADDRPDAFLADRGLSSEAIDDSL